MIEDLRKKGWTETEIQRVRSVLHQTEQNDVTYSKIVFASAILVTVIGNIIAAFILIPLLLTLKPFFLYLALVVIALALGFLYDYILVGLGHLPKRHHFAAFIIPVVALINVLTLVYFSNYLLTKFNITTTYNSWIIGSIFAVLFMLPYLASYAYKYHAKNNSSQS